MFLANKLNKGAGSPAAPVDAQFNYVTMLLHGDGTNGAQNNTFVDSGPNTFTITRNGNTTQGSFSPYGSNWSNYFDGSGDNLTTPDNSAWDLGSGTFTIESWVFPTASPAQPMIIGQWTSSYSWTMQLSNDGNRYLRALLYDGSFNDYVSSTSLQLNDWNHCAFVRESNTVSLYLNGSRIFTTSYSGTVSNSSSIVSIGADGSGSQPFQGYLSNTRVVVGTALYSGATYTVPTTPLTAVTNTRLLTCQSNRFIDNSASPKTITRNGETSVQRFNPFGASTAYSTSVIGGSGYFDGSGDYLNTANSSAFAFGTGNFTVECWINTGSNNVGLAEVSGGSTGYWMWHINAGTMSWQNTRGGANLFLITGAGAVCDNAWHHLAIVRNSSVTKAYWDGVEKASASDTTDYNGTGGNLNVAYESAAGKILNGYMSNFRIVKGTAVYTAAFTPPTAPLTAITNTSILLNTVNGAIFDNAMMNDLETVGNAQISTSVVKYGTGSMYFDGGYLFEPSNQANTLGAGDFTMEAWIYPVGVNGSICEKGYALANGFLFWYQSGQLRIRTYNGSLTQINIFASSVINTDVWQHVAAVRSSGTITLYVNGTSVASAADTHDLSSTDNFQIGAYDGYTLPVQGYIDDFRITKYARYTATFTPPTAALSDTGPY